MDTLVQNIPRKLPQRMRKYRLDGVSADPSFGIVREYATSIKRQVRLGNGLFLYGANGCGKSGALAALWNEMRKACPQIGASERIWCRARNIARTYEFNYVDAEFDERFDDIFETAKWLVVDELGRESDVRNYERRMCNLLAVRVDNRLVTHFSSNFTPDQLKEMYGLGFVSLLHEATAIVPVSGPDRRLVSDDV